MLSLRKKLWVIRQKKLGRLADLQIAMSQKISRMTVHRIWVAYKSGKGLANKPLGRPEEQLPLGVRQRIIQLRKEGHGIRRIEGLLKLEGVNVSHNKIHKLLTRLGMVVSGSKKGRRKNYVRWERKHCNSLWQTDFCWIERLECWLCAWLDDHSRFVPVAEYLTEATTENVLILFEKAAKKYGYPTQTLSERGTQFWPNLGKTCKFLEHMKSKGGGSYFCFCKEAYNLR